MSRKNGELEFIEINRLTRPRTVSSGKRRGRNRPGGTHGGRSAEMRKKSHFCWGVLAAITLGCLVLVGVASRVLPREGGVFPWLMGEARGESQEAEAFLNSQKIQEEYPEDLLEMARLNEETLDFVKDYPNRSQYQNQPIDLSEDYTPGQVPLLMQWDKRWGYNSYGDSIIAVSGCGPVCLDMAYLYFTGDTALNPREMAKFAADNGYYTEAGTSWSLWTEGAAKLGLRGETLSLDENVMKRALDNGGLIVCSMAPGDFTTTGHFILLTGYDEKGFFVNDPNRHSTSEKQWEFDTLKDQIKNLWGLYP